MQEVERKTGDTSRMDCMFPAPVQGTYLYSLVSFWQQPCVAGTCWPCWPKCRWLEFTLSLRKQRHRALAYLVQSPTTTRRSNETGPQADQGLLCFSATSRLHVIFLRPSKQEYPCSLDRHLDPERLSTLPEVTQLVTQGEGTQMQAGPSPTLMLFLPIPHFISKQTDHGCNHAASSFIKWISHVCVCVSCVYVWYDGLWPDQNLDWGSEGLGSNPGLSFPSE